MDLEAILESRPVTHPNEQGEQAPFQLDPALLRLIDRRVDEGSRTLETGAGLSTLLFAAKGCPHTCVVPFHSEIERIRAWCEEAGVSLNGVTFHQRLSEEVLPTLEPEPLDLVLIDGGHGFPTPFIDWHYAGRRLKIGGTLIVDDIHLWTGRVLTDFLTESGRWRTVERVPMRAAAFERLSADDPLEDWVAQPYVARRSYVGGPRGLVRRGVKAAHLARQRRLTELARRALHR